MTLRRRKVLGLAMEERTVLAAEVRMSGHRAALGCTAEFPFPDGLSLDDPQRLGRALAEFLRRQGFSARSAVIGVPARWLLSKEKDFPPAGSSALAGMVHLEAERSFATDLDQLMIDYANGSPPGREARVLLVAIARQKADQLLAMSQEAGLRATALVPTSMVLCSSLRLLSSQSLMLSLRPNHVELIVRSGALAPRPWCAHCRAIKHLPVTLPVHAEAAAKAPSALAAWELALAGELRRAVPMRPRSEESVAESGEPETLVIWNGANVDSNALKRLGAELSMQTELSDGPPELSTALSSSVEAPSRRGFASAAALALTGARAEAFSVDFLHSRLAGHRKPLYAKRIAWAAAIAATALAIAVLLYADWRNDERKLADLQERLDGMKSDIDSARRVVDQVAFAGGWYDQRPKFLDCLRELTLTFPAEGRIWVTSLAMREDMHMVVSGKSADKQTVLDTLDRIRASPAFTDVAPLYIRDTTGPTREVAFSLTLRYVNRK